MGGSKWDQEERAAIQEKQKQIDEAQDSMEDDDSFFKAIDVDAGPSDSELKRREEKGARDNKRRQDMINEKIKNGEELSCFDKLEPDKYGMFKSSEWSKCDQEERAAIQEKQKQIDEEKQKQIDEAKEQIAEAEDSMEDAGKEKTGLADAIKERERQLAETKEFFEGSEQQRVDGVPSESELMRRRKYN